jgi:hypothetical protein
MSEQNQRGDCKRGTDGEDNGKHVMAIDRLRLVVPRVVQCLACVLQVFDVAHILYIAGRWGTLHTRRPRRSGALVGCYRMPVAWLNASTSMTEER